MLEANRKLEKRVEELLEDGRRETGKRNVERIGDVELAIADSDLEDHDQIGLVMDVFRSSHNRAETPSCSRTAEHRPAWHVAVTDDLVQQA